MLKKITIISLFVLSGALCYAQKGKFLTLSIVPQQTWMFNKEESQHNGVIRNLASYTTAYELVFSQNLNRWAGIQYGFCASRIEQKYEIYNFPNAVAPALKGKKGVLYLKVPVSFTTNYSVGPKSVLFLSGGPQLSVLISEEGVTPFYTGPIVGVASDTLVDFDFYESSGAYRKLTLDLCGSLGWRTKIYKSIYFQFQIKGEYSLTDSENKKYDSVNNWFRSDVYYSYSKERPATHTIALGVGVGVSVKIR
jgi:hypothetical protein